ncbi:MAG TPA: hypothetical protein VHM30_03415 [Gemmatimonadaceae bacterium]|nr:hypothetical protein [Gemmatimonadaceae bacterium]
MARIGAVVLACCCGMVACGGDDPEKSIESLDSWRSSVQMATTAVRLGWVTPRYAKQVRDRATAALNETREKGPKPRRPSEQQATDAAARRLHDALDSLTAEVVR